MSVFCVCILHKAFIILYFDGFFFHCQLCPIRLCARSRLYNLLFLFFFSGSEIFSPVYIRFVKTKLSANAKMYCVFCVLSGYCVLCTYRPLCNRQEHLCVFRHGFCNENDRTNDEKEKKITQHLCIQSWLRNETTAKKRVLFFHLSLFLSLLYTLENSSMIKFLFNFLVLFIGQNKNEIVRCLLHVFSTPKYYSTRKKKNQ